MSERAQALVALYPEPRSALIPLCHLAQEQDGWLRPEAMEEIADLCGVTPAEVRGTATFYDMLFIEPVGTYVVSVCTNIACMLGGALELLEHAESSLGRPRRRHHARRRLHARRGRVPGRLRPHALRAGQPPLRRRRRRRRASTSWFRTSGPARSPTRCRRTGPWSGSAAASASRPTTRPLWASARRMAEAQAGRAAAAGGDKA